jgi:hypothetical protein
LAATLKELEGFVGAAWEDGGMTSFPEKELDLQPNRDRTLDKLVEDVRAIILAARDSAVRSVDFNRVLMYWRIGHRIVEEEQRGLARAPYGSGLINSLAHRVRPEFGSGFSSRQLNQARQFYLAYPKVNALRSQLNWSQYRLLTRMQDEGKREFYELESVRNGWNGRETEHQVNSLLFERLVKSTNREAVMAGSAWSGAN